MLVPALLLAACISSSNNDVDSEMESTDVIDLDVALNSPTIVNSTETEGGLWYRLTVDTDCSIPEPIGVQFVRVWDRHGLVWEDIVEVDANISEQLFWIPLEGEAPWIIAGETYHCSWPMKSMIHSVTNGYKLNQHPSLEYSLNTARTFYNLSFELQTGSTESRQSWEISDYAWGAHGGFPVIDENGSAFEGTIRLYYPNGELWREDRWDVTGRADASFMPLMPFPGEHEIVIESNYPSLLTLEGRYELLYMEFDEKICDHGFDWDFC